MIKQMGIYKIENKVNKMIYIGSTTNFDNRKRKHIDDLKNGAHCNFKLQNDYDKYGENNFNFFFFNMVENRDSLEREEEDEINAYLKIMGREYIYNINLTPSIDFKDIDRKEFNYQMVKDNSCKYCDDVSGDVLVSNENNIIREDEEYWVYIQDNLMILLEADDGGSSYLGDKVINYCPMCGRKLYSK